MDWANTLGTVFRRKCHCMIPVALIDGGIILHVVSYLLPEIFMMAV
jgi:hypothetical protein